MCQNVPDGVAAFFVSYECLEKYVEAWSSQVVCLYVDVCMYVCMCIYVCMYVCMSGVCIDDIF